ncbi:unnamed protein product [Danaus chrysippus]|uniref:Fucosyltransferase n=1 Tax=Danaus chrysippus TaxID=151541 RepID=A0A8J2VZ60_9NEOP|nr:unnamed protein product [Danaus chrysippus]
MDFKRPVRFPTDLKFILKWNEVFSHPNDEYSYGQRAFIVNNCSYYNCFITNTQHFLLDIRHFDAIIFDVDSEWDKHPHFRSPHQTYIFTALDHVNNGEICLTYNYDNYFNLTWTYRLDSDIIKTPFQILNKYGSIIGPKSNMAWIDPMKPTSEDVKKIIKNKKKAVAWFLTDCHTKNSKTIGTVASYVEKLLKKRNLTLDIYGWCGNLKCPKQRIEECLVLLKKDYYFYFAFEMALKEDYVTEEILQPLQNYAVPIVYGGANYSRFLPPGSYIDAVKLSGDEVVSLIEQAIRSPEIYQNYFSF